MPSDSAPTTRAEAAGRPAPPRRKDGEHRFERPLWPPPGPRRVAEDFGALYAANGVVAAVFSMTGPVAVILTEGTRGGLSQAEIASWIFGVFFLNGLLTMLACWLYRQPLAFFWTIPGTVLVGPALTHLTWPEVVGSFVVTGLLVLGLGLLLNHEYGRLQDAQARADAAEVSAEVQRAARHVEISACGGRPCIRLDRDTPTWKSRGHEYVLVDGGEN